MRHADDAPAVEFLDGADAAGRRGEPGGPARRRPAVTRAAGATCYVQRSLPAHPAAASVQVFPDLRIESAWRVVVVRPAPARPQLQSRAVFAQAGSRSLEMEIRRPVRSDAAVRLHRAGVEGTRSEWASVIGGPLVQVIAFERYESTGGVLRELGALVPGGHLLDVQ